MNKTFYFFAHTKDHFQETNNNIHAKELSYSHKEIVKRIVILLDLKPNFLQEV